MSDEDAFIAGIRENPLDDLRRLVYADWLDERGSVAEAEYLRLVAALAAPGSVVAPSHPLALRLMEVAAPLSSDWRESVGGRFSLWLDAFVPPHKIRFVMRLRAAYGTGLAEGKKYSESLPQLIDDSAQFEMLIQKVSTVGEAAIARIVPDSPHRPAGCPTSRVVLRYQVWVEESQRSGHLSNAEEHMRRTLSAHVALSHHLGSVPNLLAELAADSRPRERTVTFTLSGRMTVGKAGRVAKCWRVCLLGGESLVGMKTTPPFVGLVSVGTSQETDPS